MINEEQRKKIGDNINNVIFTSADIRASVVKKSGIFEKGEMDKMQLVIQCNIALALGTLCMFFLDNEETSLIDIARRPS